MDFSILSEELRLLLGSDTARIVQPHKRMFLIIGFKRNTATDRQNNPESGQWTKDGEPFDFDYVEEFTVASGENEEELRKSAEDYQKLLGMSWPYAFKWWEKNARKMCS